MRQSVIFTSANNSLWCHAGCHSSAIGHSCINSCRCRTTGLRWNKSFCGDPGDICAGNGMQIHVRSDMLAALTDIWNRVWIVRYGTWGLLPLWAQNSSCWSYLVVQIRHDCCVTAGYVQQDASCSTSQVALRLRSQEVPCSMPGWSFPYIILRFFQANGGALLTISHEHFLPNFKLSVR